jgi:adenylyltransferase/sulfurtransferase
VVGCGGLGCPAAAYLAAAGVGRLGLADHDSVELSNLHRQVLHTQARLGTPKALSLATSLAALNPSIQLVPHVLALSSANALDIVGQYDVILDCTDNVATRYLLNDACLLAGRALVSGSALRWEGQLTVYNWQARGPTYRCLYPRPPPAAAVTNCSDGGVLGAVPGVIGCLQALEAVKMLAGLQPSYSGSLLLFDGLEGRARVVKLRPRREGAEAAVTELIDYEQFCGAAAGDDVEARAEVLEPGDRVGPRQLAEVRAGAAPHLLVDLRPEVEQEMCGLPGALALPLTTLRRGGQVVTELLQGGRLPLYLICRRGNDSQEGVQAVRALLPGATVRDVRGGLHAWAAKVDPSFPVY